MTPTEIRAAGSLALRAACNALRKQLRLVGPAPTAAQVKGWTADACVAAIDAAQQAGTAGDLPALLAWARRVTEGKPEASAEDDQAAPQPAPEAPAPKSDASEVQKAAALLAQALAAQAPSAPALDTDAIKRIVASETLTAMEVLRKNVADTLAEQAKPRPVLLTVKSAGTERKIEGTPHKALPELIACLGAGCHVMLVGPAGSGKTTGAHQAATALGLRYFCISVCSQTTASALLGYRDANGKYVSTVYRDAFEHGGLFLLDEIDAGNPNVLAVLNAGLANGVCAFPDGMIQRHKDFRCVAAGNTWGSGKTTEYIGRNPIDAATLDRFVQLPWEYDEDMETAASANSGWVAYVQKFRATIKTRGIKHLVTPRASIYGAALLAQGVSVDRVIALTLTRGLDPETSKSVLATVGNPRVTP